MAALRWGLLIAGAVAILVLGVLRLTMRPEPPPVIKDVPDFALTHYDGSTIGREQLAGEPWIADFIFTRCPAICPRMTSQMARVADALDDGSPVRIVSISVDPEHDTPEVLAAYAAEHGAGDGWYFLTGDKEAIYALSRQGFLLGLEASSPPDVAGGNDLVIHSNRFTLVDRRGRIRGYYDPFDEAELKRLLGDVRAVLRER
jgi:protein SCO1/2